MCVTIMIMFCLFRCKQIPSPPGNGMIVVADTNHGAVGLFQCKGELLLDAIASLVVLLALEFTLNKAKKPFGAVVL